MNFRIVVFGGTKPALALKLGSPQQVVLLENNGIPFSSAGVHPERHPGVSGPESPSVRCRPLLFREISAGDDRYASDRSRIGASFIRLFLLVFNPALLVEAYRFLV
ncbi:MAG: hypothetical protein D3920_06555 [Candidatus Electrothrix sp. AW2]|nr:hypothetical protein [Candidatus Electrothrix gigas]